MSLVFLKKFAFPIIFIFLFLIIFKSIENFGVWTPPYLILEFKIVNISKCAVCVTVYSTKYQCIKYLLNILICYNIITCIYLKYKILIINGSCSVSWFPCVIRVRVRIRVVLSTIFNWTHNLYLYIISSKLRYKKLD